MNDLVAATVAEYGGDFTTLVPSDTADVGTRIGRETAAGLTAAPGADNHRVAALKFAFDRDDTGGQEALAPAQSVGGAVIDDDCARCADRPGDPRLAR